MKEKGRKDLLLADSYAKQRDIAKQKGDLETAAEFDNKIAEMALLYIENIK